MAASSSSEKQVVLIGIDDSEQSTYALNWALDHFFPSPIFKLVLIHSRPTATSAVGFAGPDSDLRKIAARVLETAKQLCFNKSVNDVTAEVVEGDPRNVLCDAVDKYRAAILVVGSHGYGAIKRAVLGSVSDYCAHHAHCTVMIVKKPKIKH
ncbi:hypothetical protein GYH30_026685 [Glycine max]|uniref:Universal stress protein A-like protein isoform B n=1 Tax=Glycine soja TaxID=3848 RepID=A0A445IGS5_GLYSO|nr:universal stress protein PHOS32-like isoform X3 [Glycine soja]KAH1136299.1 hypothetical protein GYH30_026685 [Glycine max]RZB85261.1 Universal stress protein A-like protein isoform B [Glycine soja]